MSWAHAQQTPITPDWSPRQFSRLKKDDGQTVILMHAPENIPGHGLTDFVRIAVALRHMGLSVPDIYDIQAGKSEALIEDFGDTPIDSSAIEKDAYACAIDVLAVFRDHPAQLTDYKHGYIYKKLALFSDDPQWLAAWDRIEKSLPPCPHVFAHMDYKAGNLHWLPERAGIKRIGLLDFQAAQNAPYVYDVVNLLEDARRNLAPDLKASLKTRFKTALPAAWQSMFEDWYTVMAAQFHARVLGQIRNNPRVAPDVAPRLEAYLKDELRHPALAPVRAFLAS